MRKKQGILTAIIVIIIIALIGIVAYVVYEEIINRNKTQEEETPQIEEKQEQNDVIKEPEPEEKEPEEEYVGEEEKETQKEENTEISKDEKAIELAKQTYGEDDSVTFSIEEKKDNIYYIAVKSNATVISWYEVDTDEWTISEFY